MDYRLDVDEWGIPQVQPVIGHSDDLGPLENYESGLPDRQSRSYDRTIQVTLTLLIGTYWPDSQFHSV